MPVPFLDVNAQNDPIRGELLAAFQGVLTSGQFIMGSPVAAFEDACAAFTGSAHNLGVSSGTDAILLALMVVGIQPGDEVIVPAFTFFATAGCVSRLGATPVFADVRADTCTIDTDHAASLITAKTRAIIPVHLFGHPAPMDEVMDLAGKHNLHVIEDSAQAFGTRYRGQWAGSIGDFGCYSFFPSKNLGALGDAGLLSCRNPEHAEKARILRVHGMKPKYCHHEIGGNFRLDTLQAAFLLEKIKHLPGYLSRRKANADRYTQAFQSLPGFATTGTGNTTPGRHSDPSSGSVPVIVLPSGMEAEHSWNQYTIRLPQPGARDALRNQLQNEGIGSEVYYPSSLDQQPCYQTASSPVLPVSSMLAGQVISLPIYPELSDLQIREVIDSIARFVANSLKDTTTN